MSEELHFVVEDEEERRSNVSLAVIVSAVFHTLLVIFLITHYHSISQADQATPTVRYVQLLRQNPEFTEAPGPKTKTAKLNAPFSDANRHASMPEPTGTRPTIRPGEGGLVSPAMKSAESERMRQKAAEAASELTAKPQQQQQAQAAPVTPTDGSGATFQYRPTQASATGGINWNQAIKEVGKVASIGTGQNGVDLPQQGGEKGYAESGPLSFESQWYDWGDYAQSMVNKIRINWYSNMPQLIQTGMKGVVTIRFTIQRSGAITDIVILESSGRPPYDFAAKKAIELSSPLNPLPADFPNSTERVTCMFFYNEQPPQR